MDSYIISPSTNFKHRNNFPEDGFNFNHIEIEHQPDRFDDSLENIDDNIDNIENNYFSSTNGAAFFTVDISNQEKNDENDIYYQEHLQIRDENPKFKLPPRLAARLYKKHEQSAKIFKCLENVGPITENNPLFRRDTIVVRSKKAKLEAEHAMIVSSENSQFNHEQNKTILMENVAEDSKYVNWINSVIANSFKIENITVDTARIINECIMSEASNSTRMNQNNGLTTKSNSDCISNTKPFNVPLKDDIVGIAYKEEKLMDILRAKAIELYESDDMKLVREVLLEDLRVPRYYIRKDRSIHADVGSKKHILELLLNYNPLWLKVALETIFGQRMTRSSKNEVHTLIQFLTQNLLSFKALALKKNFKNVTTYFINENHVKAAKVHILYHFLMIVHFLDVAKLKRLINHDPCLFRSNAECKSSRALVLLFTRDYITGVGDITKSLRNAGILLQYVQNPIEEFNFTVTKLSSDLRCGVRLARLLEIILLRNDILPRLHFPSHNITRKLHNLEVVFQMLKPFIKDFEKNFTPKEICTGCRPKTILLLDELIEIYRLRMRDIEWQQSIDSIVKIQRTYRRWKECKAQRKYFLELRKATIFVQRLFRAKLVSQTLRKEFLLSKNAAILIESYWRGYYQRKSYLKLKNAAIAIQNLYRAKKAMQKIRSDYLRLKTATILIQNRFRLRRQFQNEFHRFRLMRQSAIKIQRFYKTFKQRKWFLNLVRTTVRVQILYKAKLEARRERQRFLNLKSQTIKLQRKWREKQRNKELERAALIIQRRFRANKLMLEERSRYLQSRWAILVIQKRFRATVEANRERKWFLERKQAAIKIQRFYREQKRSNMFRNVVESYIKKMKNSATIIQKNWRGYKLRKAIDQEYIAFKLIRKRLEIITRDVTEDKLLINVIARSIERMSRTQSVDHLYHEFEKIEKGTTYSITICQTISKYEWFFQVLLMAFNSLNRSEPHKKVIMHILIIFSNILNRTDSKYLYSNMEFLNVLFRIIRNFPKSNSIIQKTLDILNILTEDRKTLAMFKKQKNLTSTLEIFLRKNVSIKSNETPRMLRRQSIGNLNPNRSKDLVEDIVGGIIGPMIFYHFIGNENDKIHLVFVLVI
ncbi:abnormal spindle-like protein [Sarcoptes scabiei]|uniref:Abnormal spindle-like protein n=1 Tax=Sarcoptes scabiei TaxID=52283 RepID=A0A132AJF0_SARSC|nr:abnormal spindle-like protein [Sarcoptes scabiei]